MKSENSLFHENDFQSVLKKSNRRIVIHHTHLIPNITDYLKKDDLLFFDDCIHEQFVFFNRNKELFNKLNINCVFSFSHGIYRDDLDEPIDGVTTNELHERIHNGDETAKKSFMSLNEIEILQLNNENVFMACHGFNHVELYDRNISQIDKIKMFYEDINKINHSYEIFVYPYDYVVPHTELFLKKLGYKYIFPIISKRVYIEELIKR